MKTVTTLAVCLALAGCDPSYCDPDAIQTICTVAGSERAGFDGNGEDARVAELYQPMDVTVHEGSMYIVDWNNHQIRAVDEDGIITTVVGTGALGDGPPGPALEADFNHPTALEFGEDGMMYIAAWHNSRIRRVNLQTGVMEELVGTGMRAYTGDGGPAAMAALDLPASIQFEADGSLLVVDQANQVIRRITDLDGDMMIERVAGQCIVVGGCPDGGTPARCGMSQRMACSPELCDDPATMSLKPCEPAYGGDGGPALEARFAMPFGQSADPAGRIALDPEGNIYLADTRNHRIRRIGTDGMVTTIAGTGEAGYGGDGGPATAAQLNNPVDLEFDEDGALYIADTFNSCVRVISLDGDISTVAGQCGTSSRGFEGDGASPTEALLDWPYGIDIADGVLYIADTMNNRIRVVRL
jgi:hypothetical protein